MDFSPEMFAAFLQIIRDSGVLEFEGFGFKVRFGTLPLHVDESTVQVDPAPRPVTNETMWDNPSLWPGGRKPSFPGK